MSYEKEAFFKICHDAKPAKSSYVSLYANQPYFGGPEEGGWWGHDTVLVAYYECVNDGEAQAVLAMVHGEAARMSRDAKDDFNRACAAECEWLEARGLDDDFLPEVNGEESYWATIENQPGEHVSEGSRRYE
jgi:hypothetical protein